ncbi:MAG TPA: thioredoxin domain-containing protein [Bryobacteraceae bacterium]|nr:thioredoxin domain-containing protein [Bryobacteraceae bacterium]
MHTNALIREKSPYLRQHAHNPVDWLPWGQAAFEKARLEDKPIFLSIGYSTCHWCHVMAHESFEDVQVAEILNRDFVPVKVDREERPDVDRIYMLFIQSSTGSGGWPMSVFLTPELKPFFGGTYFPPGSRYGRPGFRDLLAHLAQAWKQDRDKVEVSGNNIAEQLRSMAAPAKASLEPNAELFDSGFQYFRRSFDPVLGGFGNAPKFPRPVVLNYLLAYYHLRGNDEALDMVLTTLRAMAAGGMHDHLGGGFHRYSVDEHWFVPHFEKMLYDQAQLAISYLEAFQITRDEQFATVARGIFDYIQRDLTDAEGGFYSAEDADSPDPENPKHSGEGSFYIWRKREIEELLGKESTLFCNHFGVKPDGNVEHDPQGEFTGRNILFNEGPETAPELADRLSAASKVLLAARSRRPRPHLDNKILTSWNALYISALARGFRVLGEARYLTAARRAAAFLMTRMYDAGSGQLTRRYCDGEAAIPAFLDDYAFFAQALLDLYEASSESRYLRTAVDLANRGLSRFENREGSGFFSTEENVGDLLLRLQDDYDGAEPSGNSVATDVLLRLAHITGDENFRDRATRSLRAFAPKLKAQPAIAPQMLVALGRWLSEPEQIVIRSGDQDPEAKVLLEERARQFAPYRLLFEMDDSAALDLASVSPFLASLERKGRITVYECRNFACELPQIIA